MPQLVARFIRAKCLSLGVTSPTGSGRANVPWLRARTLVATTTKDRILIVKGFVRSDKKVSMKDGS